MSTLGYAGTVASTFALTGIPDTQTYLSDQIAGLATSPGQMPLDIYAGNLTVTTGMASFTGSLPPRTVVAPLESGEPTSRWAR